MYIKKNNRNKMVQQFTDLPKKKKLLIQKLIIPINKLNSTKTIIFFFENISLFFFFFENEHI